MTTKKGTSKKHKTIAWEAPEFQYVEKSVDWFWVVGVTGLLLSGVSYISGNWTFASLILLSTVILMILSVRKPQIIQVKLQQKSISLNDKSYKLKNYNAFNIDEERNKLLLHPVKKYVPLTIVPLPVNSPSEKIIDLLEDKLEMEYRKSIHEPILEVIMHRWGF